MADELRLGDLAVELQDSCSHVDVLVDVLRRVQRARALPELPALKPLRSRLLQYVSVCRVRQLADAEQQYEAVLSQLSAAVSQHEASASEESMSRIADAYGWLSRYQQAPRTCSMLRERFGKSNVIVEVGPQMLTLADTIKIDRDLDIDAVHEGFHTTGRGKVLGTVKIQYVPNTDAAQMRVSFQGNADCAVRTNRRNVFVWGRLDAQFHGNQDFLITTRVDSREDVDVKVRCRYCPHAARVQAQCEALGQALSRVTVRVARNRRPEIEQQSNQEVRKLVVPEVQKIIDQQLEQANDAIAQQVLEPLDAADIRPLVNTSTSDRGFSLRGTIAASDQLAASREAIDDATASHAARLRCHESLLNNLAVLMEGMELDPQDVRMSLGDLLGMEIAVPQSAQTLGYLQMIQFADQQPLVVRLRDDMVWITLRLQAFGDGEHLFRRDGIWEVTTAYRLRSRGISDFGQGACDPCNWCPTRGQKSVRCRRFWKAFCFSGPQPLHTRQSDSRCSASI